ncbi:hypothetical protein BACCAP_00011 [Pseudoflavonifractor capillosus ATCC 29799]|uniref:Uncharacterized protein n=1 Tax=Pseudoflavonifractor capillosus ATCC 29799 TaxID=411467 RepID=A6NPC0_9FIRM|nr:hypothetical protein BACCAP_00011 [Pseudoflavonifractor capillosus ATCC 29799]
MKSEQEIRRYLRRPGRSPHGERGLKFRMVHNQTAAERRSPHGERGLKFS